MRRFLFLVAVLASPALHAADAAKLDADARSALRHLYDTHKATEVVVGHGAGTLVFPHVLKAGAGVGAEFGEGTLIEHDQVTGHYNMVSGSIGFQLGAQKYAQVIVFTEPAALAKFKASTGFKIGVDGSVVVATAGKSGEIDSQKLRSPIVAFILDEKGLMYEASLEGSKITKLDK
jgi:lipid-binding SYLF domain-containing protein